MELYAHPGVRQIEITATEAAWSIGAIWRKEDKNPVLLQFLKLLKTLSKSPQ